MLSGLTLALLLLGAVADAETVVSGTVAGIEGDGWTASDIRWQILGTENQPGLRLQVSGLTLSARDLALTDIELNCDAIFLGIERQSCAGATIRASINGERFTGSGEFERGPGGVIVAADLALADIAASVRIEFGDDGWKLELPALQAGLVAANRLVPVFPESMSLTSGAISASGKWQWEDGAWQASMDYTVSDLGFDNADGTLAGSALAGQGTLSGRSDGDAARWDPALQLQSGEFLLDPLYISFLDLPALRLTAGIDLNGDQAQVDFQVSDPDALELSGTAAVSMQAASVSIESMRLQVQQLLLDRSWPRYFNAAAEALGWSGLLPGGSIRAALQVQQNSLEQITVNLDGVQLDDMAGRFEIQQLNGVVDYDFDGDSVDSSLDWQTLRYYDLAIGPAETRFFTGGRQFQLLDPLFAPVLDGGIDVRELVLTDLGLETLSLDFAASIRPISLELISRALNWPVLLGTLSGDIPRVQLRDGVAEVGGAIRLRLFDGDVEIDQLRLERVLGVLPTLAADIEIANLDLEQMTGAFSFGLIQGRLDGSIQGLRLLDWEPVAFDAWLATPESGRRKISQKALDNLSSIGGGAAALGQTFLGVFDQFSYRRLGIRCRLLDNICSMAGVAPAARGYYLVQGSGIPRIDVIGYSDRVDWPQLVRRLKAATRSEGPEFD